MRNTFYQSKEKYGFKKLKWCNERYFVPKTFFQTALYRFLFMNMGWGRQSVSVWKRNGRARLFDALRSAY